MKKKKLLAAYILSLTLTASNFLPAYTEAVQSDTDKNIINQADNNSTADNQWTTTTTNPIDLTSPDTPNTPAAPDTSASPDTSTTPDNSAMPDTSTTPDNSAMPYTSTTSDASTTPADKAKFAFPVKDICRQTCGFLVQLPRRTAIFTAGVVIGTPVSVVRESIEDTNNDMKDLIGDKTNPLLLGAAGTMTILPHSLFSGLIEGVSYGITNSFKHCSDAQINQETLGLKEASRNSNLHRLFMKRLSLY